jgi:hypothetical protein
MAGVKETDAGCGVVLFRGTVILGFLSSAFMRDSVRWVEQIKRCPRWMRNSLLAVGAYAVFVFCLQAVFPEGNGPYQILTVTGVLLVFDTLYLCILYPVLWLDYLDESELRKRSMYSIIFLSVIVLFFIARRMVRT